MILSLKKYAFLAFLFVGVVSVSAATFIPPSSHIIVTSLSREDAQEMLSQYEAFECASEIYLKRFEFKSLSIGEFISTIRASPLPRAHDIAQAVGDLHTLLLKNNKSKDDLLFFLGIFKEKIKTLKRFLESKHRESVSLLNFSPLARPAWQDLGAVAATAGVTSAQRDAASTDRSLCAVSPAKKPACGQPSCSKEGESRCSRCRQVFYCSVKCQREHWKTHQAYCKPAEAPKQ